MHDENRGLRLIANKLGISITAVSRAIRNEKDIGYDLKERIWEEAVAVSYQSPSVKKARAKRNHLVVLAGGPDDYREDLAALFEGMSRRLVIMPLRETITVHDIEDILRVGAESVVACRPLEHRAELLASLYRLPVYRLEDILDLDCFADDYRLDYRIY